jgi:hypothetical protein
MPLAMNVSRFRAPGLLRRKLPLATTANLRVAHIANSACFDSVKLFQPGQWIEIEQYRPRVLVGVAADLQELAERVESGLVELSSVDHAVFILTACGQAPLTDVLRVVLWQTFGVPVYELFMAPSGLLAASECETHDGWHAEPGATFSLSKDDELLLDAFGRKRIRTGLTASLENNPCPCGRPGLRLMNVALRAQSVHHFAATA